MAISAGHEFAAGSEVSLERMLAEPTFDFLTDDPIFRDYWMATIIAAAVRRGSSLSSGDWTASWREFAAASA